MIFFKKIFAEKEAKEVLAALNLAESEFKNIFIPFFGDTFSKIKRTVEQEILDEPKGNIKKQIKDGKVTATTAMYFFLADVIADYLGTGDYHFYRGELKSQGKMLYQILKIALEKLEAGGFCNHEEAEKFKSVVDEDIRRVG